MNGAELARQLGALPPQGSATEERMAKAFNLTTRVKRRLASGPEPVADGVWVVRGGFPSKTMNVYLMRDGDGVMLFDAGIKAMTGAVAAAGASLGGITRVVLGHGHPDHRGVAPYLGVPVLCHADNREDAEGDGGMRYFDFSKLKPYARPVFPYLLRMWDGGPVDDRRHGLRGRRARRLRGRRPARATRRASSACGAPPTAWRWSATASTPSIRRPGSTATRASPTRRSTTTPSRRAPRSASSPRWSPPPRGQATPTR